MPRYFEQLDAPPGKTDVLFVTDARCSIPPEVRNPFLAWKRAAGARLVTLVVGNEPGDLSQVSDECHRVRELSASGEAVGRVLSL